MTPQPPSHVCHDCETAWYDRDTYSTCWSCGRQCERAGIGALSQRLGRTSPGFDRQAVVA